jgi:hypothetical protein
LTYAGINAQNFIQSLLITSFLNREQHVCFMKDRGHAAAEKKYGSYSEVSQIFPHLVILSFHGHILPKLKVFK